MPHQVQNFNEEIGITFLKAKPEILELKIIETEMKNSLEWLNNRSEQINTLENK
jgi:hypothetical protein